MNFNVLGEIPINRRFLFGFGKKKTSSTRPGAMDSDTIRKTVIDFGVGKKVVVNMVDYSGNVIEETPIIITSIQEDHFTGRVVNVDREIMEGDNNKVYLKGGGGTVDFYYTDGDIADIREDIDNEIIASMNNHEIKEILEALEMGDEILLSYYDNRSGGVINGMGNLSGKDLDTETFKVQLFLINDIQQDPPKEHELALAKHKIIALQIT